MSFSFVVAWQDNDMESVKRDAKKNSQFEALQQQS